MPRPKALPGGPSRTDNRTQPWRRWYRTARWQAIRSDVLTRSPQCVMCQGDGRTTPATVCDHVIPHRGDEVRFWNGPFQALCASCHNRSKKLIEGRGYATAIGRDGWPIDERHPVNKGPGGRNL